MELVAGNDFVVQASNFNNIASIMYLYQDADFKITDTIKFSIGKIASNNIAAQVYIAGKLFIIRVALRKLY